MSLIYGYSKEKGEDSSAVTSLKSLVGSKTDDVVDNTAFGRIQKNKEDIVSSAASVVASTSKVVAKRSLNHWTKNRRQNSRHSIWKD